MLNHIPPSEPGIKEVVLTAFRFVLDELRVAYEQIILFGRSIGSGPAIYLASRFPVGGLILVAPFASVREVIRYLVGSVIAKAFDERFPNISLIGNVSCPTLFIHGEKDNLVPPSQSVALFKQCRARKLLITPPTMEHNTNLFTDASFLAVPAINFFGLPGYQQDQPPQMAQKYFEVESGRQAFLLRKSSRRKIPKDDAWGLGSNPWFFLCGCPTNKRIERAGGSGGIGTMEHEPKDSLREYEMDQDPKALTIDSADATPMTKAGSGAPASAGRETAAAVAARIGNITDDAVDVHMKDTDSWRELPPERPGSF
jgi:hypothetical protein